MQKYLSGEVEYNKKRYFFFIVLLTMKSLTITHLNIYFQAYPDYYQIIKQPIDLRFIAQKIQANHYRSLDDLSSDLLLMIQNAKTYNTIQSDIYKVIQYNSICQTIFKMQFVLLLRKELKSIIVNIFRLWDNRQYLKILSNTKTDTCD